MDDDSRDMPKAEETASRSVDDETDDGEGDIVSPNTLEEPGGDDSSEGAREGVEEDGDKYGQSSGTPAAIEDLDEEGFNRQGRGSSYDSNISDVIVVAPGTSDDDEALQLAPKTKTQERKEKAASKSTKEDARKQEIRAETAARRERSRGDARA